MYTYVRLYIRYGSWWTPRATAPGAALPQRDIPSFCISSDKYYGVFKFFIDFPWKKRVMCSDYNKPTSFFCLFPRMIGLPDLLFPLSISLVKLARTGVSGGLIVFFRKPQFSPISFDDYPSTHLGDSDGLYSPRDKFQMRKASQPRIYLSLFICVAFRVILHWTVCIYWLE